MKETLKDIAQSGVPSTITVTAFMGIPWNQWVYILGAMYWVILIVRSFPKMYGCVVCFYKNRTCSRKCQDYTK